ncbi:MAG: hypothetical protein ACOCVY_00115 [Patescibacteria group bacterium]
MNNTEHDNKIEDLIDQNAFQKRRLSWVAQDDNFFYKIPRISRSLKADIENEKIKQEASSEYEQLKILNRGAPYLVKEPVDLSLKYSCIINKKISGPDLREELLRSKDNSYIEKELKKVIEKIAKLHQDNFKDELPVRDYSRIQNLEKDILSKVDKRPRVVNARGFSVRNLRYDKNGDVFFFDPTGLSLGAPEEGLANIVFSLLLLKWGRNHQCFVFNNFALEELLGYYESRSGIEVDTDVFFAMLDLRMHSQERSVRKKMKRLIPISIILLVYTKIFFYQINKWKKQNYEKLRKRNQRAL